MMKTQKQIEAEADLKPRILVVGVGGAGGNAVNNMIRSKLEGVSFIAMNTDAQALEQSLAPTKIQLGPSITQGLGAGSKPDVGKSAAEESLDYVLEPFQGANMVFITAGMGGGTGTGGASVIARIAREMGILTIGVVTKPFHFEGTHRMRLAEQGIIELQHYVDTLIVIPNQNLFRIATDRTTFADAFKMADDVLYSGVRGITDLMIMPGLINLDFADVRSVMGEKGKAMMGTGEAEAEGRALQAAEAAISNPLLDDVSMRGAKGVLISITGGYDMTLYEVDEAANRIREEVDPDANIIFGSTFDEKLNGKMRVSIVATGIDAQLEARNSFQPASVGIPMEPAHSPMMGHTHTAPSSDLFTFTASNTEDLFFPLQKESPSVAVPPSVGQAANLQSTQAQTTAPADFLSVLNAASPTGEDASFHSHGGNAQDTSERDRKLSLFERLTGVGRRAQQERLRQATHLAEGVTSLSHDTPSVSNEDAESLEIPAFLRRQEGK